MKKLLCLLFLLLVPHLTEAYYVCHPCCRGRFDIPGWWFSADYMLLCRKERFYPPLVTTNPNGFPSLDTPGTEILFGGQNLRTKPRSGGRFDAGIWMTPCLGFGGGLFCLGQEKRNFKAEGDANGLPILGRPFFDVTAGIETAELISFPLGPRVGNIRIETNNVAWGFEGYARYRFLASCCFKFDLLAGGLAIDLHDDIDIRSESLLFFGPILLNTTHVRDSFHTTNQFCAGLLGAMAEWRSCNWAITGSGKFGLGKMDQKVDIRGTTTTTPLGGVTIVTQGGLLAPVNLLGEHRFTRCQVVCMADADLQLRIAGPLWLTTGYTLVWWPSVLLAGEQINLNLNPAPPFRPVRKSFWIQGLTAGLYIFY